MADGSAMIEGLELRSTGTSNDDRGDDVVIDGKQSAGDIFLTRLLIVGGVKQEAIANA